MTKLRSHCPINFSLEEFGDKWTLLILRDMVFRGKSTYGEFLKSDEGFATNILASRLESLESKGILEKLVDPEDARKSRYSLSEKGIDLVPVLFQMMIWGEKHDPKSEARRIPELMDHLKNDFRRFTEKTKERLRKGKPLFPDYLG